MPNIVPGTLCRVSHSSLEPEIRGAFVVAERVSDEESVPHPITGELLWRANKSPAWWCRSAVTGATLPWRGAAVAERPIAARRLIPLNAPGLPAENEETEKEKENV